MESSSSTTVTDDESLAQATNLANNGAAESIPKAMAAPAPAAATTTTTANSTAPVATESLSRDCANCGAVERSGKDAPRHNACARCRVTFYCSAGCQRDHWKRGGHRLVCVSSTSEKEIVPEKEYRRGVDLRDVKEDFAESVKCFRRAAGKGHTAAMVELGRAYQRGQGCIASCSSASNWFRKAAMAGDASAQLELGLMYEAGTAVDSPASTLGVVNMVEATRWFGKAAEQGVPRAQYEMAVACAEGTGGVPQDDYVAVQWLRKSAAQGNDSAQYALGVTYDEGKFVDQDADVAQDWYEKAAAQGNTKAMFNLGTNYLEGSPGRVPDAALAIEWFRQAAELGYAEAQFNMGIMHADGQGVEQSFEKALEWTLKAAEQGLANAQCNVGCMYAEGHGAKQDLSIALRWFHRASQQGHTQAQEATKHYLQEKREQQALETMILEERSSKAARNKTTLEKEAAATAAIRDFEAEFGTFEDEVAKEYMKLNGETNASGQKPKVDRDSASSKGELLSQRSQRSVPTSTSKDAQDPKSTTSKALPVGSRVKLHDIRKPADLNGKLGTVVGHVSTRVSVLVDDDKGSFNLKPSNLALLES